MKGSLLKPRAPSASRRAHLRVPALGMLLAAGSLVVACDATHSLEFVNGTTSTLEVQYAIRRKNDTEPLVQRTFSLAPGASFTTEVASFYLGKVLDVTASAAGSFTLTRTYTYDDLEAKRFRVELGVP